MTLAKGVRFAALAGALLLSSAAYAQEPIKIGSSLPLTGNFSVTGEKHRQGFELCVDLINQKGGVLGRQVELIVSDNRSDTETAISQYRAADQCRQRRHRLRDLLLQADLPASAIINKYNMIHPVPAGGALRIWMQGFQHHVLFPAERRRAARRPS